MSARIRRALSPNDALGQDETYPDRRAHGNFHEDEHSFASFDFSNPAPRCVTTAWLVITDPVSYHGVRESSWHLLAQFAHGRGREVCRLLGEGLKIKEIADRVQCSEHTARDDARKIFHEVISGQAQQQIDLVDTPEQQQYIPTRSTRGRKKKPRVPEDGGDQ